MLGAKPRENKGVHPGVHPGDSSGPNQVFPMSKGDGPESCDANTKKIIVNFLELRLIIRCQMHGPCRPTCILTAIPLLVSFSTMDLGQLLLLAKYLLEASPCSLRPKSLP